MENSEDCAAFIGAVMKCNGKGKPSGLPCKGASGTSKGGNTVCGKGFKGRCFNCDGEGHAAQDCLHYNPRRDGPHAKRQSSNVNSMKNSESAWSLIVDDHITNMYGTQLQRNGHVLQIEHHQHPLIRHLTSRVQNSSVSKTRTPLHQQKHYDMTLLRRHLRRNAA